MMCIYYKGTTGLNYKGGDHIFPDGIGGKQKLPKGYVSDEFNTYISDFELHLQRHSLESIARKIHGPVKSKKKPYRKIELIQDDNVLDSFSLGYVIKNRVYTIPYIMVNMTTGYAPFGYSKSENGTTDFVEKCSSPESLIIKSFAKDNLPLDIFLFGVAEGLEGKFNAFFVKNSNNPLELSHKLIIDLGRHFKVHESIESIAITFQPRIHSTVTFRPDNLKALAKIAFNYLAHITNDEFVLQDRFDEFRNWITTNSDARFAYRTEPNPEILRIPFPEKSHFVLLAKVNNSLFAQVYLYRGLCSTILLCRNFEEDFKPRIFICEYEKEGLEYEVDLLAEQLADEFKNLK